MSTITTSILAGLLIAIFCFEAKAWAPRIIARLVAIAVSRVPSSLRDRLHEEWTAHIDEIPGVVGRLAAAVGFMFAARRLVDREPFSERMKALTFVAEFSFGLIGSAIVSIARERRDWGKLAFAIQVSLQLWRLCSPAIDGMRPATFAYNVLDSMSQMARIINENEKAVYDVALAELRIDPATGELGRKPESSL